ncbi:hypothetical protein ACSFB8_09325 [Enterococcus faecalis]
MWITNSGEMVKLLYIELAFVVVIGMLILSLLGKRNKKQYSWEQKRGANTFLVLLAIILLIVLAVSVGVYLYKRNTIII